jgi:GNAT superfamily N-acetyltransferase
MTRSDIRSIFKLQNEFETYLQNLTNRDRKTSAAEREKRFLKDGFGKGRAFHGLVATKRDSLLGYICYHFGYDPDEMHGKVIYVIDLFVTKKARKLGIGTLLMKSVASICKKMHGTDVYFCVWIKNKNAIKFYRSLGAELVKEVPLMRWSADKWKINS